MLIDSRVPLGGWEGSSPCLQASGPTTRPRPWALDNGISDAVRDDGVGGVCQGLLQADGGEGGGVVGLDQLLQARDDLVVRHRQGVHVQAQHARHHAAEVQQLCR